MTKKRSKREAPAQEPGQFPLWDSDSALGQLYDVVRWLEHVDTSEDEIALWVDIIRKRIPAYSNDPSPLEDRLRAVVNQVTPTDLNAIRNARRMIERLQIMLPIARQRLAFQAQVDATKRKDQIRNTRISTSRIGKLGAVNHAIEAIATKIGTRDHDAVLDVLRDAVGGESDLFEDLRHRTEDPVQIEIIAHEDDVFEYRKRNGKTGKFKIKTVTNRLGAKKK